MTEDGIITAPVSIYDVKKTIGISSNDVATLCSSTNINPMARYKPVRYNTPGIAADSVFVGERFGLSKSLPSFKTNNSNPSVTWSYNHIVPGTNWSRLTDFNGYDHYACPPFAFDVTSIELGENGGMGMPIYINSSAGGYYANKGSKRRWIDGHAIKIDEIIRGVNSSEGNQATTESYLGFCIHDLTAPTGGNVFVVTNKKLKDLGTSVPTIILYAKQRNTSGVNYPAVPLLADRGRANHTFRVIACLTNSGPSNPTANAYEVRSGSYDVYSLAIEAGIDRRDCVAKYYESISLLVCSFSPEYSLNLVKVRSAAEIKFSNGSTHILDEYKIENGIVRANFTTPSDHWQVTRVNTTVTLSTGNGSGSGNGYTSIGTYGYIDSDNANAANFSQEVNLPQAGTTYPYVQIASYMSARFYWDPAVPVAERKVIVRGKADHINEVVNFTNTITVSATS